MLTEIIDTITPHLAELIAGVLTVLIAAGYGEVRRFLRVRLGIQIEAIDREALHSALLSGALAAVARADGASMDSLVDQAVAYARDSVPDALARLNPAMETLTRLALSKVEMALGGGTPEVRPL